MQARNIGFSSMTVDAIKKGMIINSEIQGKLIIRGTQTLKQDHKLIYYSFEEDLKHGVNSVYEYSSRKDLPRTDFHLVGWLTRKAQKALSKIKKS